MTMIMMMMMMMIIIIMSSLQVKKLRFSSLLIWSQGTQRAEQ